MSFKLYCSACQKHRKPTLSMGSGFLCSKCFYPFSPNVYTDSTIRQYISAMDPAIARIWKTKRCICGHRQERHILSMSYNMVANEVRYLQPRALSCKHKGCSCKKFSDETLAWFKAQVT